MEQDQESSSASETSIDTTVTVTDSLAELIVDKQGGIDFAALSEDYTLPYDSQVKLNEAKFHEFAKTLCGEELYFEPGLEEGGIAEMLKEGGRVLDIGCGMEGDWVTAMACRFPKAEIVGVDLVPVSLSWSPPNSTFHIFDVTNGVLPFDDSYFDVVHVRSASMWIKLEHRMSEIRRVLKPGGVFLLFEVRNALHRLDPPSSELIEIFRTCDLTFPSWVERFDHLTEIIKNNISSAGTERNIEDGELADVQEKMVEVHVGRRSGVAEHLQIEKAGKLYRESLLGYLSLQMYQFPWGKIATGDRRLVRMKRFQMLAGLLNQNGGVDSALWETVKMVWGRKEEEKELPEGGGEETGDKKKETVEAVFERLLEPRRTLGAKH